MRIIFKNLMMSIKDRVFVEDVLKISLICLLKGEVLGEWL